MYNLVKATVIAALFAITPPALALDLDAMTDREKDLFGQQVREYLLQNPEVIMQVFSILEQRQQATELQEDTALVNAYLSEIQNDGFSWVGGNPDGDITLVEFLDYKCGYCRKAHNEVANLVKTDGNIKLVVKEYPILGEASYDLSRAAVATLQGLGSDAYKKMYNQFIKHDGPVTNEVITFLANKVNLDGQIIVAKMDDPSVADQIAKTRQLGEDLNINGTPTFIINGEIIRGYVPADTMKVIIAELRTQTQ